MLHEKSLIEHNARTLDAATRAYLQADTRLANDNTPNVVVWNNRESVMTMNKDQQISEAPLSPTSPTKSYLTNEKAIYAGLEDSDASEEDGINGYLTNHLMNA